MNLDASRVHAQVFHIRICGQCSKHGFQCAVVPPFGKSGVHRLPWAIHLRQFPPLRSAVGNPKHPIEHFPIIFPWAATLPCSFWRKYRFHAFPLFFCQFISFHVSIFAPTHDLCNIYFSNNPYVVAYIGSEVCDWTYVSITPREIFFSHLTGIQLATWIGMLLCVLLGVANAYIFSRRNYRKVRALTDRIVEEGELAGAQGNEFEQLGQYIELSQNYKKEIRQRLDSHREILRKNYLHDLLFGIAQENSAVQESLEGCGVSFTSPYFAAAVVDGEGVQSARGRLVLESLFEELSGEQLAIWSCRIGSGLALILNPASADGGSLRSVFSPELQRKLSNCVRAADVEQSRGLIRDITESLAKDESISADLARCVMFAVINTVLNALDGMKALPAGKVPSRRLLACRTMEEMSAVLSETLDAVEQCAAQQAQQKENGLEDGVKAFVAEHYADYSLNISVISEAMQMNPAYLSRCFREKSGVSLLDYLNLFRISKAEELMRKTKSSLQEIAEQVGYNNSNALIRAYKKYRGITPGKYRELLSQEEEQRS